MGDNKLSDEMLGGGGGERKGGGGGGGEEEEREGRAGSDGISPHIGSKAIQGLCADF